jgi:hypothetical protein
LEELLLDEFELELLDEFELEFELLLDELPPRIRFNSSTWLGAHAAPPRTAAAPSVKALTCQDVRRFFDISTPLSGRTRRSAAPQRCPCAMSTP